MAKPGLRKVFKYSEEFNATAVALSQLEGVAVRDVATELDIHPLRKMKKDYEPLKEEHDILKKSIRFISERRQKSSSSSKHIGK